MINYVFDVDGTLTPSRQEMDFNLKQQFFDCMRYKNVYFITGSDADKTIEQIGRDLWSQAVAYQCCGNDIYAFGKKVSTSSWPPENDKIFAALEADLKNAKFPDRYGNHIEVRPGMINYSVVGRDCSQEQREEYFEWDSRVGSRKKFQKKMYSLFPKLEVSIGGQISVDIHPKGQNKGQVFNWLKDEGPVYFFGDQTQEGGNDYPLAHEIEKAGNPHKVFQVSGPEETLQILRSLI